MRTTPNLAMAPFVLGVAVTLAANCFGQKQTVTLVVDNNHPRTTYTVATNQVVKIISIAGAPPSGVALYHSSGTSVGTTNIGTFTGLTNVSVAAPYKSYIVNGTNYYDYYPGLVTLEIESPATANVVSNYVPADAIVIPASATGSVQIILESSPDLVNWTAASPGTYGPSAGTNRFFRVHGVANP